MEELTVSFKIKGNWLADGIELSEKNLKEAILNDLSVEGISYFGNRDIDCKVTNLSIKKR